MQRLAHKVALITGAAQGIGLAIANDFHQHGATVILSDLNESDCAKHASKLGDRAESIALDIRDEAAWESAINTIRSKHNTLDILVNNAGITGFDDAPEKQAPEAHDPENATLDAWRRVHTTNLDGTFLGCKHAIRAMRHNPGATGSIINLGSRSGVVGIPRAAAYASSKSAIRNHTKSVALYCAEEGLKIRCNTIQPAAILTPMWEPMLGEGEDRKANIAKFVAGTPLNRFGTVEEVASIAVYLASDESAYTTGAEFNLDGGMLAGTATPPAPSTT
ncbi:MAG: SDR family NAD(P)-dependent oxidoreductase [Phycisphaerales bacterium]